MAIQRVISYKMYEIGYTIAIPDPDMPSPRYHNVIFVETGPDGSGIIHHVTGDITSGMYYDTKRGGEDRKIPKCSTPNNTWA